MHAHVNKQSTRIRSTPSSEVFQDLRVRNERRARVAKVMEAQRKRRIERGRDAQLSRWVRKTP
jgi:hypothetical protein